MKGRFLLPPAQWSIVVFLFACSADESPGSEDGFSTVLSDIDGTVRAIFAPSAEVMYVVGGRSGRGMILRYDGVEWVRMDGAGQQDLLAIWGSGETDLRAVGEQGTILHYDGGAWSSEFSGTEATLRGLWGSSDGIWIVGGTKDIPSLILQFDGQAWLPDPDSGAWPSILHGVWGAHEQVWIVGSMADGESLILERVVPESSDEEGTWMRAPSSTQINLVAVGGDSRVFAVGLSSTGVGAIVERAEEWTETWHIPEPLSGLAVDDDGAWFVGAAGYAARLEFATPNDVPREVPTHTDRCLRAAWSDPAWGAWAVGGSCPGDSDSLGIILHLGDPEVAGGPIRNFESDAGTPDASLDASIPDAYLGIPPGEECPAGTGCAPGLDCWFLADVYKFICTRPCGDEASCEDEYDDACCDEPGPQTATTVCMPRIYGACP